jgi:glycosyltransferase involved in cell wall biosynthesis
MASRGVRLKGWATAVEALSRMPVASAELLLVGEGEYLDELRRAAVPPHVHFIGFSANPVDWIMESDVGLLPSEFPHESLPTAVMEYLYCGKPVIATDVGEISAMLSTPDGQRAGILLGFDDQRVSVEELSAAMQAYVDDPGLRERHAALARGAFAKFDMGACAAAYSALYAEVVRSSSIKRSH